MWPVVYSSRGDRRYWSESGRASAKQWNLSVPVQCAGVADSVEINLQEKRFQVGIPLGPEQQQ